MDEQAWHHLLHRAPGTHKYDYGHVLIIGGSKAMAGAPVLAARAALRVGAGLVTIASTEDTVRLIDRDIEEIMTLSLPPWNETERVLTILEVFMRERHVSVVVIGSGLPTAADQLIRTFLPKIGQAIVIDAEALTSLSRHLWVLKAVTKVNKAVILTPHSGEYARLTGDKIPQDREAEQDSISRFAREYHVTIILKHQHTLIANAQGTIYENTTGNPGLATAGTGDVLAGMVGGMLAQKIELYAAAQMAVYLHGSAADIAVKTKTEPGMIASDIIEAIPQALELLDN